MGVRCRLEGSRMAVAWTPLHEAVPPDQRPRAFRLNADGVVFLMIIYMTGFVDRAKCHLGKVCRRKCALDDVGRVRRHEFFGGHFASVLLQVVGAFQYQGLRGRWTVVREVLM